MGRSWWYTPGDWALPDWWTEGPAARGSEPLTHEEQRTFYEGWFVRDVLGHKGGMTCTPETKPR